MYYRHHLMGWAVSVVAVLLAATNAFAESPNAALGLQMGFDYSTPKFQPLGTRQSVDPGIDVSVGVNAEFQIMDYLFFQPELIYNKKSFELQDAANPNTQTELSYKFLEVPLYAKAKWDLGSFKPYAFAGPNFGFVISADQIITLSSANIKTDISDVTESFNFAIDAGLGTEYWVAPTTALFINGRYSYGFTDISKGATKIQTRDVKAVAGVKFTI